MDLLRSRINSSEYFSHNLSLLSPGVCLPPGSCTEHNSQYQTRLYILYIQTEDDSWHFLFQLVCMPVLGAWYYTITTELNVFTKFLRVLSIIGNSFYFCLMILKTNFPLGDKKNKLMTERWWRCRQVSIPALGQIYNIGAYRCIQYLMIKL